MKMKFSNEQMAYIKNTLNIDNIVFSDATKLTDDQVCDIVDKATIRLMRYGFDENYEPTTDGLMCESILDILGDL